MSFAAIRSGLIGGAAGLVLGLNTAAAQSVTTAFSYQGVLDDGGQLANGTYDFRFRLFDAAVDGNQVVPATFNLDVVVVDGLVELAPNFGDVISGQQVWLEVGVRPADVGPYAQLTRVELLAVPNALFAKSSEVADTAGFAMTSGTTLQDAFDNGPQIDSQGSALRLQDSARSTAIDVFFSDGFGTTSSDELRLVSGAGEEFFRIAEDITGTGGFLVVNNGTSTNTGFVVDGNTMGTNSTAVFIQGNSDIIFDSSGTGDETVVLPSDAISPFETAAEAGIAFSSGAVGPALTATTAAIESRSITPPADGFVVAIATAQFFVDHVTGLDTAVGVSLNTTAGVAGPQLARIEIERSVGTDSSLGRSVTIHDVFPANARETLTIFVNADASGLGTDTDVRDTQLTLLFVPTAYGVVSRDPGATRRAAGDDPERTVRTRPALTAADTAAEREASIDANLARMQAEMDAMRAEIEAMRAQRGKNTLRTNR